MGSCTSGPTTKTVKSNRVDQGYNSNQIMNSPMQQNGNMNNVNNLNNMKMPNNINNNNVMINNNVNQPVLVTSNENYQRNRINTFPPGEIYFLRHKEAA
jgi:hypothetical protein